VWLPRFACPECSELVTADGDGGFVCPTCAAAFPRVLGIFRFMAPSRALSLEPFLRQYRAVREQDGFRETSPEYYRALPMVRREDPRAAEWRVRRESYALLQARALPAVWDGAMRILDLGAGNCWLSHRLAASGHHVVAVDCLDDEVDGLGVYRHYPVSFVAVQGDFDALPFAPLQFEVVVLNGSLHYSRDPIATLEGAKAMLAPGGVVAVMDSPMFVTDRAGLAMLDAQRRRWAEACGDGTGPVQPGVGYLTFDLLARAADALGLRAEFFPSRGPLGWRVRRELGRIRLGRAPAAFGVWVAR
jgi:SAM-dependent methyltransferase